MPATVVRGPRVRELSQRQMESVLSRNHVARLAFVSAGRIELLPVHYVFTEGRFLGRTSFGTKYVAWLEGPDVVLEVDESEGPYDWRSVIARGRVRLLRDRGASAEPADYWSAVASLRAYFPKAFMDDDPTPRRTAIFSILPTSLSGREATAR